MASLSLLPQCAVLREVLESLRVANSSSISWETCCENWVNIVTCKNNQIVELNLSNMGLQGTIPNAMALERLRDLEVLDLSNNPLTGTLPNWFRNLRNLRELHIWGTGRTGLSGELPSVLKDMTKLEKINLSTNGFTGSIQVLSNLDALVEIRLASNKLDGPINLPWDKFRKLKILHLADNTFTDSIPENIAEASNLEELELQLNKLSGNIPESLSKLKSLSTLKLNNNSLKNGTIPKLPLVKKECTLIAESSGNNEGNSFSCKSPNITQTELNENICLKNLPRTITLSDVPTCALPPPPKAEAPPAAPALPAIEPSRGLPIVAIVGIVVGVLALLAVAMFFVLRRRRRRANKQRDLDATTIDTKPTPQQPAFPGSIAGNPPRMSVIVDAHGNRHSIHLPSHVADGSQFILVQQQPPPPPQPTAHAFARAPAPAPEHHAYMRDMRLARQSITSDPSSLASSTQHHQQPMFVMHPNAAPSANGPSAHSVPMPPVPPVFLPSEHVYLGDNPRASMSTVATATTVATEAGAPAAVDDAKPETVAEGAKQDTDVEGAKQDTDVEGAKQDTDVEGANQGQEVAEAAKSVAVSPAPRVPVASEGFVREAVVREAVADRPVSMVTVNVPDGYTVSLVPISRPQTPAVAGRELRSTSASSQSGV